MLDSIQNAEQEIEKNRQKQLDMERELKHMEKLAAVGQLAAGVAHELGTPLSTISGTAQRALRSDNTGNTATAFDTIRHEVYRMEVIIRHLLDFSHHQKLKPRILHPENVVRSAILAVHDEAEQHKTSIITVGSEDEQTFEADPIRIEQALVNLLRNAIHSTPNGHVRVRWETEQDRMILSVDDDGPGIPDAIRDRVFEPFFTTKDVGEGTGLGLAVVHGIIKDHQGSINIIPSDSGGTCVEMRFPLMQNKT